MTPNQKVKQKAKIINYAFDFTADDLQANRRGQLTARQRDRISRRGIPWLIRASAIALILMFLIPVIMKSSMLGADSVPLILLMIWSIFAILYYPIQYNRSIGDALQVKSLIKVEGYGFIRGSRLIINGTELNLNYQQRKALDTTPYLICYCITISDLYILSYEADSR